jgi:hypothetical protein
MRLIDLLYIDISLTDSAASALNMGFVLTVGFLVLLRIKTTLSGGEFIQRTDIITMLIFGSLLGSVMVNLVSELGANIKSWKRRLASENSASEKAE